MVTGGNYALDAKDGSRGLAAPGKCSVMGAMLRVLKELRPTLMLAVPITFGSASMIVMGALDSLMIGRVGTTPLAASAFSTGIFNFFYIVGIGLLLPVSVLVARSHGAGNKHECAEWLRHSLAVALATGIAGCAIMGLLSLRLDLFQQPPEVVEEARAFYLLFAISMVPVMLFQALRQYAEVLGFAWVAMVILFAMVALNAGLNWVLIYGNLGFPPLGLVGAGFATLVSRIACVAVLGLWLQRRLRTQGEWPQGKSLRERWLQPLLGAHLREMFRLGVPSAGQLLFEVCAFTAGGIMMGWIGTQALAAHQIALSCASLTFMVPLGLSAAAGMRISHALGAKKEHRIRPIGMGAFAAAWLAMGCFALLLILFGREISGWFIQDGEVVEIAVHLLVIVALFQLFDGTQVVGTGSLRGLSDVHVPTLITAIAYSVIAIPTSYIVGVRGIGPDGVWMGLAAGLAFAATTLFWRFLMQTREK